MKGGGGLGIPGLLGAAGGLDFQLHHGRGGDGEQVLTSFHWDPVLHTNISIYLYIYIYTCAYIHDIYIYV